MMAAASVNKAAYCLGHLLDGLHEAASQYRQLQYERLCMDSRDVQAGDVFLAISGVQQDALHYAAAAIENGAVAVVHESPATDALQETANRHEVPLIQDSLLQEHIGIMASRHYGEPSQHMKVTAVTGTDGKTSVSHFIAQALTSVVAGEKAACGIIGTLGNGLYGRLVEGTHTTPDALSLQALLAQMRQQQADYVCMEASSHGLQQGRLNGVCFAVAVLTNLGRDHLDYHRDVESYRQAKARLFASPQLQSAVLNMDDAFGRQLWQRHREQYPITLYGLTQTGFDYTQAHDWIVGDVRDFAEHGFCLHLIVPEQTFECEVPLLGRFNASNVLAMIGALRCLGLPMDAIIRAVTTLRAVPGRMQLLQKSGFPSIVIDYAHTSQALESVLTGLREHYSGRVICVFGCGGNRDKGKRPLMGHIAEQYADKVIITDDNPRHESPRQIADDILAGCINARAIDVIHSRADAIVTAINSALMGDVVLIAGKGHETSQQYQDEKRPFSDCEVVEAVFAKAEAVC